ncbi:hypothetical protein [Zhihengliuella halotolerans]|uniref:Uncharacterized protein n=1 Tax=Zhihengliuella halotolerans TaxID=370736 RepID=A0A4Q8AF25_9MICC|nr:hypothetical protein [Zhihengliuella halotolerans]RZU62848.1 hypothetical protein EV380_2453 [Zhihengliuella halotolerans]
MAQQINNMPPAPAPGGAHQSKTNAGKGLGIAALVIGIVALVLSWVPIVNNFAAILAVIALVLAIIGLVVAVKKNGSKGLSIAGAIIFVVALVVVFASRASVRAGRPTTKSALTFPQKRPTEPPSASAASSTSPATTTPSGNPGS